VRAPPARLLLLGVSVRALAASAARSRIVAARYPGGILAIDFFGDADLLRLPVEALSLPRDLGRSRTVLSLVRAALRLRWQALIYAGGIENRPALLARLQARGTVLGNDAATVRRLRDPEVFFPSLGRLGIRHPRTFVGREAGEPLRGRRSPRGRTRYLWKGSRSGGGMRLGLARPGESRPRGRYLQELLPGPVGSVAFVADGTRAAILGVTEQISGWNELGGSGFRYGGNIAGPPQALLPPGALPILSDAASAIARRFGLRGLNGLDFVVTRGVPHVLEVNPRYTASMELLEEISGVNLIDLHLEALAGGPLPDGLLVASPGRRQGPPFLGKGILYAERTVRGVEPERLAALGCRDIPVAGETIRAGQPVCTVIAPGRSPDDCRRNLVALAAQAKGLLDVPGRLRAWRGGAAALRGNVLG
jgi:predicted ATP-grasp superfamily ATP-dependent carboligase